MFNWQTLLLLSLIRGTLSSQINERSFTYEDLIERDVAIIGGGASGTYAAVQLHDLNKTIVLIERDDHLGGHVNTYRIPGTNTTIEYGVQTYMRYGNAEAFYKRMGVEIAGPYSPRQSENINVDVTNGKKLTTYTPPSADETSTALKRWLDFTKKYSKILEPGLWDFPTPDAIPEELLLPFAEVAYKYNLEAAVPRAAAIGNFGFRGIKDLLTLYVVMGFAYPVAQATVEGSFFIPKGSNSLLYQKATELLNHNVILSSQVVDGERSDSGVKLITRSEDGSLKLIKAKKLLISAPPSLENMTPFKMDKKEKEIFDTWQPTWSFVGIAKVPCIPENNSLTFLPPSVTPADYLGVREYPFFLRLDSTGPVGGHLYRVIFGTNFSISSDEAKQTIQSTLQKAVDVGTIKYTGLCEPEYVAWTDHNNILWKNDAGLIRTGFVQKLYGLQGLKSTWYTGLTFCEHYSSNVWAFTDTVLTSLVKSL